MTQSKFAKTDVQKAIFEQTINNETIFYSYACKYQATLTILKNQRLLIFNSKTGLLYYVNEPKSLPFLNDLPRPKNDTANMNVSMVKNPSGTNEFRVQFGTKNQKGQITPIQWTFLMDNKNLASSWVNLIKQFKERKMQEVFEENKKKHKSPDKSKDQPNDPTKNSRIISNNAFMHDTIGYGMIQVPKYNSKVPLSEPIEQSKHRDSPIKIIQSRHEKSPKSPINQRNNLRQSNIKPTPHVQGQTKPVDNNLLLIPGILNSREQGNKEFSPQRKSLPCENDSRLTFKDQIESIISRSKNYRESSPAKSYRPENDWNLKFLQNQSQSVIMDFEQYAVQQFFSMINEDRKSRDSIRVYLRPDCMVIATDARTIEAKKIKSQFRNYHFITESCKDHFIVGVSLACLIEFEGVVALIKSLIPEHAPRLELTQELMLDLKDLERYTRVKNAVLRKATIYDLSQIYGSTGKRLIYINQLIEYLPLHIEESLIGGSLRPEHMLDHVDQFMCGGLVVDGSRHDVKILNDTLELIKRNVTLLAKQLSCNDVTFVTGPELKDIMHSRGINLKYLPQLYHETQNRQVKKYIHTFMVAKISKDSILENLAETRSVDEAHGVREVVEKSMRLLVEGNSNMSNELWKEIAVNFRKEYGTPMSNNDILGPFFLSCLMKLIPGQYDLERVDLSKVMFKDDRILERGFLAELLPKVKSYNRYTTEKTQKVILVCKGERLYENYLDLVEALELRSKKIPRSLTLSKNENAVKEYMSFYTCPSEFEPSSFPHIGIFQSVLTEPPTSTSLMITYNYLIWCLEKEQFDQFKQVLEATLRLIDVWLDPAHVLHCEFYEALSQYYEQVGSVEDSINFMKESLGVCIRSGGLAGRKTGEKYMAVGEKLLKAGQLTESVENLVKAKTSFETHKVTTLKYPLLLSKIASVCLCQSDFASCLQYAKLAVEKFEELQSRQSATPKGFYDQFSIKVVEIMSRAFEVEDKKNEVYRIAQMAASKYNKTPNEKVFALMVKLCLTAVVVKHNLEKAKVLESMVEKVILSGQTQDLLDEDSSLAELMRLGQQFNVMDRFMFKFENLERVATEINSRRALSNENKEFVGVLKLVIGLVGEDYLFGLIQQKEVEG